MWEASAIIWNGCGLIGRSRREENGNIQWFVSAIKGSIKRPLVPAPKFRLFKAENEISA